MSTNGRWNLIRHLKGMSSVRIHASCLLQCPTLLKNKPSVSGSGSVIAFRLKTILKHNTQLGPAGKGIINDIPKLSDLICNIDDEKNPKKVNDS
jgi:hypothetical protein